MKRFACLLLIASLSLYAQAKKGKKGIRDNPEAPQVVDLGEARLAGEISGERVSDPGKQSDWPAVAAAADGSLYAIYVVWNDKDADRVVVRRRDPDGKWNPAVEINDNDWDHYSPTIVARGKGALAIWSGQSQSGFDLYAAEISPAGKVSKIERLTRAPFSDFNARAVADSAGKVTVVWQSFRDGNADIYARRLSGKSWGPETRISS